MTLLRDRFPILVLVPVGVAVAFWSAWTMPDQYCPWERSAVLLRSLGELAGALIAAAGVSVSVHRRLGRLFFSALTFAIVAILVVFTAEFLFNYFNTLGLMFCGDGDAARNTHLYWPLQGLR